LATQVQLRDFTALRNSLGFAIRLVNFVTLPATVGLIVLAEPLSSVLFFRGAFSANAVKETAVALQGYAIGLWAVALTRLLSVCLYAFQDTRTPAVGGVAAFLAKIGFSLMLMGKVVLAADARSIAHFFASLSSIFMLVNWGAAGLALATSLSAIVNLVIQAGAVSRRLGHLPWRAWLSSLIWSLAGCGVMFIPLQWTARHVNWVDPGTTFTNRCVMLTIAILAGSLSYLVVAWRGGHDEIRTLIGMLPQRALRFLPQLFQPRG
jgi:putative peptidoglycan lipid II flippase